MGITSLQIEPRPTSPPAALLLCIMGEKGAEGAGSRSTGLPTARWDCISLSCELRNERAVATGPPTPRLVGESAKRAVAAVRPPPSRPRRVGESAMCPWAGSSPERDV